MKGNKPFDRIKISNGVEIVFWKKTKVIDGKAIPTMYTSIAKSYKDAKGEWVNQTVFMNMNDLFRLFASSHRVKEIEDIFKQQAYQMQQEQQPVVSDENLP